jgi:ribulose-phosphate 3-epimerase
MKKLIAPSILSADFTKLGSEIQAIEAAGADWLHIDVMDGHFVPNISMGPLVVKAAKKVTPIPLDVHLMISHPDQYISQFAHDGADLISVHAESCIHLNRTIDLIKSCGCKPGVVLNPATPLTAIEWVLECVDFVLIMSVNPGFGGQSFIHNSIDKIRLLKEMIRIRGLSTLIQVDGGVTETNIRDISEAGADIFVAGSAIFGKKNYKKTINAMKRQLL